jgi:hypothetical protein
MHDRGRGIDAANGMKRHYDLRFPVISPNAVQRRRRSVVARRFRSMGFAVVTTLVTGMGTGCGRQTPANLAMNEAATPIDQLAEAVDNPKRFQSLFVAGSAPAESLRKRYGEFAWQVISITNVSDTETNLRVRADDGKADRPSEVDGVIVKEGGRWKLKSAPLP